jgi:DNA polymerase-1
MSKDPLLISQFRKGLDIHCAVGNALTGWSFERIKAEKNLRKMVKNMHFGIVFGINEENVYDYVVAKIREIDGENADLTGITPETCKKCFRMYFVRYKGVARFIETMRAKAERDGYVETIFGFRRSIYQEDETRDTYWGNQAINSPIQGSAHTLVLMAMALLHQKPVTYSLLRPRPIMEVHDALFFLVKLRDLPRAFAQGKQLLETEVVEYSKKYFGKTLQVPLIAEAEAGFCLGSCVEFTGQPLPEFLDAWRAKHQKVEKESWKTLLPKVA